jgi:ADP-ribosylglycohydrolase
MQVPDRLKPAFRIALPLAAAVLVLMAAGAAWTASTGSPATPGALPAANPSTPAPAPVRKITFNEAELRDRIYACWIGKAAGATLGLPFKGHQDIGAAAFYTDPKAGAMPALESLDPQILSLKVLEDGTGRTESRLLAVYWLKHLLVEKNEYGPALSNIRVGLLPPLSGEFNNAAWKDSNAGWCRTEIWACVAPGCPALAATLAREDASIDHGSGEGTLAAIFLAAVESAAFVEPDRDRLLALGLQVIPDTCGVAAGVRAAIESHKAGKEWKLARDEVIQATAKTGWQQSPRDVGFMVLAWLYGDGDFGKSVTLAANAGDCTDGQAGAVGALLGIIGGTKAIPAKWRDPLGEKITTVALAGVAAPATLKEMADRTIAAARKTLQREGSPVMIGAGPADLAGAGEILAAAPAAVRALYQIPPKQVVWSEPDLRVLFDYQADPILSPDKPFQTKVTVENLSKAALPLGVRLDRLPRSWQAACNPAAAPPLAPGASATMTVTFVAGEVESGPHSMWLEVAGGASRVRIPVVLFGSAQPVADAVGPDDLALASKGAVATADSELDKDTSAAKIIDGVIATLRDIRNRWQSSPATTHPHWVQVKLPKVETIGQVVIRFADPGVHPVDFFGQALRAEGGWVELFRREGYTSGRLFRAEIRPVRTDTFRLFILRSSNTLDPTAAQISEIELYPPAKAPEAPTPPPRPKG